MTWLANHGTYLAGQEAIDTLDIVAINMERKWGADRLRLLVDEPLRIRFDRQRHTTNQAIWNGGLEDVQRETRRMANAWRTLDKAVEPARVLPPTIWEVALPDGTVAQIVRESDQASLQAAQEAQAGRKVAIYTLEEIGRLLANFPSLYATKTSFPGAIVTQVRLSVKDPLASMELELSEDTP